MKRAAVVLLLVLSVVATFAEDKIRKKDKAEIEVILEKQVAAWNEGNLEKFMDTYWKSEQLVFVGGRGPSYGWQAALDNYKLGYPNKAAMGTLNLKLLKMSKIDTKTVLVVGRFELTREIGDVAGHFSLVIQEINERWLIISDHSSSE